MKRILLLTAVLLTAVLHVCAEKTAQALWCEDNTTLYLTYDETAYAAGDTYNGQTVTSASTDFGTASKAPEWNATVKASMTTVVFDASFADYKPTSCREWFAGCTELTTITGLTNLNTEDVTSMHHMFYDCQSLTAIDLSNFNTAKVTDMSGMFRQCWKVTELDVTKFNTENVTNMDYMFDMGITKSVWGSGYTSNTNALATLDVSGFKTEKVTSMACMFRGCSKLTTLNVSNFKTGSVKNMTDMFGYCSELTEINVAGFNTEKVTNMSQMFEYCSKVTSLNVSHFNTENVTLMNSMFDNCSALTSLNVSNFNTGKVTNMNKMFSSCRRLTTLDLTNFDTRNVTDMSWMFNSCQSMTDLKISSFNTENVTTMTYMFNSCSAIEKLDVAGFNTQNVIDMSKMFSSCTKLKDVDVSNFNTSKVTGNNRGGAPESFYLMFGDCSSLETLDISKWDTGNAQDFDGMFYHCSKLKGLDVSKWDTKNATTMSGMFDGCVNVPELDVSHFITDNVMNMSEMFRDCSKLTSLDLSSFKTPKVKSFANMFCGCTNITGLDVSTFSTKVATNTSGMFWKCEKMETLTFGKNFTTRIVTNMSNMFHGCHVLKSLDVTMFNTAKVASMEYMFSECHALTELNILNFNTAKNMNFQWMFEVLPVTRLDLRNFSTAGLTKNGYCMAMFNHCNNLKCIYGPKDGLSQSKLNINDYAPFDEDAVLIGGNGTIYNKENHPNSNANGYFRADGFGGDGYLTYTVFMDNKLVEGKANNVRRLDANEAGTPPGGVTLSNRTLFKDGHWNTLCLPFSLKAEDIANSPLAGATIMGLASSTLETKEFKFNFEEVTAIEAGKPYILKWESGENIKNPHFDKVTITSLEPQTVTVGEGKAQVQFIGTYDPAPLAKDDKTSFFVGSDDQLYYPNVENYQVNACRGYFKISDGVVAASRRVVMNFGNKLEGIGHIENSQATTSQDAQTAYDLQGRRVTNPTKGLYIVNGKKVMK